MSNHPNRSKSSALRYIVYSLASHNALSFGGGVLEALDNASSHLKDAATGILDTDLIMIFATRSKDSLDRFDGGKWPSDAAIVFRGANELAQRYRRRA